MRYKNRALLTAHPLPTIYKPDMFRCLICVSKLARGTKGTESKAQPTNLSPLFLFSPVSTLLGYGTTCHSFHLNTSRPQSNETCRDRMKKQGGRPRNALFPPLLPVPVSLQVPHGFAPITPLSCFLSKEEISVLPCIFFFVCVYSLSARVHMSLSLSFPCLGLLCSFFGATHIKSRHEAQHNIREMLFLNALFLQVYRPSFKH